jgi:hypothetical protein
MPGLDEKAAEKPRTDWLMLCLYVFGPRLGPHLIYSEGITEMTEEVAETVEGYKIWKNPANREQSVEYLGEACPPNGQFYFTARDLKELGFGPGHYTIRAPEGEKRHPLFSKWQNVSVPE